MNIWFKLLPLELQEVTTFKEPADRVGTGEKLVGTLSDDLKRLYTYWMDLARKAEEAKVQANYAGPGEKEELVARYSELASKALALKHLFWVAVNDEFHLWGDVQMLAVRTGFQVVAMPPPEGMFKFFPGFGGGD